MRDLLAGLVAAFLTFVALGLAGALHQYRRRRRAARTEAGAQGRSVVAEIPAGADLTLFTEGEHDFTFGATSIEKRTIRGVRLLINGSPIAASTSPLFPDAAPPPLIAMNDQFEGLLRDRWDVAIDTTAGTVMVECGAIRERISQELGRAIFDAVRHALDSASAPGSGPS